MPESELMPIIEVQLEEGDILSYTEEPEGFSRSSAQQRSEPAAWQRTGLEPGEDGVSPHVEPEFVEAAYAEHIEPEPAASPIPSASHSGTVSESARLLYAVEDLRSKNHTTAALFAFFLGFFGIHKFYLGYNQSGFVMLAISMIGGVLTFGLATIVVEMIAIIEGVIYLTKNDSDFNHIYVVNQRDWF